MRHPRSAPYRPARPPQRRLRLPSHPTGPPAVPRPAADTAISPSQVWGRLSPQQQAQLRQTLLQILQEVISHANSR
jgi:hypothetical protein